MLNYRRYIVFWIIVAMCQLVADAHENKKINVLPERNYKIQSSQPTQINQTIQHSTTTDFDQSQRPYPYKFAILGCRPDGMFSAFDDVFDLIKRYELGQYKGIEVDFEEWGLYYEPSHGKNWWSYYFKPICFGKKNNIKNIKYPTFPKYIIFSQTENITRREIFNSVQKYFKIKSHVQKKIDALAKELFKDFFVISVHYRGTDKTIEAPAVPYEKVSEEILRVMKNHGHKKYRIFVATDEQDFLNYIISVFGDIVCYNKDALRSTNGKPVHTNKKLNRYKAGEDAVIDCILLSKGDILIRTSSNLSRWSTYFNPRIPVIKLNTQFVYEK